MGCAGATDHRSQAGAGNVDIGTPQEGAIGNEKRGTDCPQFTPAVGCLGALHSCNLAEVTMRLVLGRGSGERVRWRIASHDKKVKERSGEWRARWSQ
jgi:hypothetical protein